MAKVYTYPHWETNVIDRSIYQSLNRESLPLFRPIFFIKAQQGPVGVPVWCDNYSDAVNKFGAQTFDMNTEYYSRESLFLAHLLSRQGAFIVRLAASDADYASLVLEVQVHRGPVPQYKRDAYGQYVYDDATDERIPLLDNNGVEVYEEGVTLKWVTRPLKLHADHPETISNLKPRTYGTGANAYTVYPILAVKANNVGKFANSIGFKFFADVAAMDTTLANTIGSFLYEFGAVKKSYITETVSPIYSFFTNQFESFAAKQHQVDVRMDRNVSFDNIFADSYPDERVAFEPHFYSEYVKEIGQIIQEVELEDETLTDPYLCNIASEYNVDDVPMPHVHMSDDDDAIVLNDTRIFYLEGGKDGSIDTTTIEILTRQYLDDLIYPEILNQARYPFTHMVDTGVGIETKRSMIRFLSKNDAFKVMLSTQDCNMNRMNTKAEDLSAGSSLYASCLLQPESVLKGTECFRAEIYQHAGYLADSAYRGIIPFTLDAMLKKSQFQSTTSITGNPGGLPNSAVTRFKTYNWTASEADHKQRSWDSGLNYVQHYDMSNIHYPAIRTVYRYDTSVLTSATFTDAIIYIKHLVRYNWARFAGIEAKFEIVASRAESALTLDINSMLGGMYNFTVVFSQTEEEARLGYKSHATVQIWGNPQQRVWEVDIETYRNGYDVNQEQEVTL